MLLNCNELILFSNLIKYVALVDTIFLILFDIPAHAFWMRMQEMNIISFGWFRWNESIEKWLCINWKCHHSRHFFLSSVLVNLYILSIGVPFESIPASGFCCAYRKCALNGKWHAIQLRKFVFHSFFHPSSSSSMSSILKCCCRIQTHIKIDTKLKM